MDPRAGYLWRCRSDRDFFEGAALYLAGRSLRQVRQEQNSFRRLVVRQPLPGKLHQLLLANLLTFAEGNKRDNLFSIDGMRLTNDSSLDDGRMLVERVLHFLRRDVRATADDDLFLAAHEPEVPVGVATHEIARIKPSVA